MMEFLKQQKKECFHSSIHGLNNSLAKLQQMLESNYACCRIEIGRLLLVLGVEIELML